MTTAHADDGGERVDDLSSGDHGSDGAAADFSLVLGGPLYQIWRRTHLAGSTLQSVSRRILVFVLVTWLPLLVLSVAERHAWGTRVVVPFLYDVEQHIRFLVAVPLLLIAEPVVHLRLRAVVSRFIERGLVPVSERGAFDAAIASSMRLRNSIWLELGLILVAYVIGVGVVWRTQMQIDAQSWSGVFVKGVFRPSIAGWWLWCVSLPISQFLLLRWYFRLFIWAQLLWRISRIKLALMPTYPDRCGGLGFLTLINRAFAPLLLAQGALLAGLMANRILYAGATLPQFKVELVLLVSFVVFAVLGPLLLFSPQLAECKRTGLREHGALAERYVREYDHKWLRGGASVHESPLGSSDIQSLADLGNSFAVVADMRLAPFSLRTVLQLAAITLLPIAPLTLTMLSLEQLIDQLLQVVF